MKKICCVVMICMLCMAMLCGCSADTENGKNAPEDQTIYQEEEIQLDLAGMSGTVVYSMIYNIMSDPSQFLGQVIRLEGYYSIYEDVDQGKVYHACIIPDATACCAQGMEFVRAGEHAYPEEYPELGTEMIVTGRLETYTEYGIQYLHLVDAEVVWKTPDETGRFHTAGKAERASRYPEKKHPVPAAKRRAGCFSMQWMGHYG